MSLSVLYGCDDNYAPYTGISMTSLFDNNKGIDEITIYLAAMNISRKNLEKFSTIAKKYNRNIVVLDTESAQSKMLENNCGTWNGSIATWLRFFVLEQIPESVDKLVWLDSDTIVESGIDQIILEANDNLPVAAVCDSLSYWQRFRLGFQLTDPYYNAGVIVFNLTLWREDNTVQKMMHHLEKNIDKYMVNDQDLLNDYFKGQIAKLPMRYNIQSILIEYDLKTYYSIYKWLPAAYYSREEIQKELDAPVVIHFFRFLGDYPWTQGKNFHPAKELYEGWKQKSLWKDHPGAKARNETIFRVEKILFQLLPRRLFLKLFAWYTNREIPSKPF